MPAATQKPRHSFSQRTIVGPCLKHLSTFGRFLGRRPSDLGVLFTSVGLPTTTISTQPYSSTTLVFTLERDFNLDNSIPLHVSGQGR